MAQYNTLNVKLSNLQLNKIKSGTKNGNEITLEILSNVIGDSNDGNNFSHNLFLIHKLQKAFANNSSANIKLSTTQLYKIKLLGWISESLLKIVLPLIENVLKPLAKSVLIPLELSAGASATDATIYKTMLESGVTT